MLFRSSNSKFVHYQGDILSNVDDSSHGVHLTGGSTGGVIQPCGDEDNIALTVRGKGTGAVSLGNSSQAVLVGGSTSGLRGVVRVQSTTVVLADASTEVRMIDSTITVTGANSSALIVANEITTDTSLFLVDASCTAANEVVLSWIKPHKLASTESTRTVRVVAFNF